jgi:cardiolipin synthase
VLEGHAVDLLIDGTQAFPAMLEAIEQARAFASLETYIFQADGIGHRFRDALAAAARRGVEVRVLYDSIGSLDADSSFWRPLRETGAEAVEFHPLAKWRQRWPDTLNRRDHRKVLVVDGEVGFCGGINIHDKVLPEDQEGGGWRDTHVRIRGPGVRELHRMFLQSWRYAGGAVPADVGRLLPRPDRPGRTRLQVAATAAFTRRRTIQRAYLHALRRAREFVYLWNPYFVPVRSVRRALRNARQRGVDVRVIVPARGDIMPVQFASRALYASLMRAGIRIFEWREHVMHAKCGVIDGLWSTVGSYNLDHRSLLHNLELNVMIYGPEFGREMVSMFERDLESCAEVDPDSWPFRPLLDRLLERFFYMFRHWL